MSSRRDRGVIFGGLLLALLVAVGAIAQKEQLIANGEQVLLELAPVDPRSLMSGDYMRLDYAIHREISDAVIAADDGHVVVRLDSRGVATFVRLDRGEALAPSERRMRYRRRGGELKIGPNAYHFQEGHAAYYEEARYGAFRLSEDGDVLLVGLYQADLTESGPPAE